LTAGAWGNGFCSSMFLEGHAILMQGQLLSISSIA